MIRVEDEATPGASRGHLERLNRLYAVLSRINRTIVRADDPHDLYESACRIAVEHGDFGCAWIGLIEPAGQRLVSVAHAGVALDVQAMDISFAYAVAKDQPVGGVLRENRPLIVNDIRDTRLLPPCWIELIDGVGMRAMAAFPLSLERHVVGALLVASAEVGYFDDAVVRLLAEVVEDISFSLEAMRRDEKRVAAESKIRYLAYYDAQTGLPSRILFSERLAAVCDADDCKEVAVLVANLRQYHHVLEALGDRAGTEVMRRLASRLESLMPTAVVGRISESEFAVILERSEGLHLVEECAWRIHGALAETVVVDGREIFMAPFVGIAIHPRDGTAADVLKAAVMAAAKGPLDAGSCCRFFVADMDRVSRERLELEAALRRALERQEFVLHFQPQVDLVSGGIVGAEALLRWQRPGKGLVPPGAFIPLLEETGLIVQVGEWAMQEACRFAKRCQDEGLPRFRVAVNLSVRQFQDGDVGAQVRQALNVSGLDPQCLELEITESLVLVNADAIIRTMNELRASGVSHALDDFGTGYSSLSYLQRLPVSRIKIDQSFVSNITSDPGAAAIVRAVVAMAHNLGIAVIAEGVETEGQLGFLRGLQCEEMQGYYFSRPVPGDEFRKLLREDRRIAAAAPETGKKRFVLVVDDEPNVLSALRRLLRNTDMHLLATPSIQEGFNLLATHSVGVVMCDQRMPEMTGTEFLRRVRQLHPAAVRIVFSGYTDLNSVIDAVNRGAIYKFMTKPWDDQALIDCLRDAFRLYEMEKENRELSRRLTELVTTLTAGQRLQ